MTTITKFRTSSFGIKIEEIEVERETEHSVWIKGSRNGKFTDYNQYHETYEQAYNHIESRYSQKLTSAQYQLDTAINELKAVKALKK